MRTRLMAWFDLQFFGRRWTTIPPSWNSPFFRFFVVSEDFEYFFFAGVKPLSLIYVYKTHMRFKQIYILTREKRTSGRPDCTRRPAAASTKAAWWPGTRPARTVVFLDDDGNGGAPRPRVSGSRCPTWRAHRSCRDGSNEGASAPNLS